MSKKKEFWERKSDQPFTFRVWDKMNQLFINNGWCFAVHNDGCLILDSPEWIVQECIGCKDRDGKFIFEGDILETDEAGWKGVVVFGDGRFSLEDSNGGFSAMPSWDGCKIIGNVYQNPELIP